MSESIVEADKTTAPGSIHCGCCYASKLPSKECAVVIDPRTLKEVKQSGDCHLIPAMFKVSDLTVRLDRDVDSKIGGKCDSELKTYLDLFFGPLIEGKVSLDGGSKNLKGLLRVTDGKIFVPKPSSTPLAGFVDRALNVRDGKVQYKEFTSHTQDGCAAFLSIVHSAFLVLYFLGKPDVFAEPFNWVRNLVSKLLSESLTNADYELMRDLIRLNFAVPKDKVTETAVPFEKLRKLYDPTVDAEDGVLDDFPQKCLREVDEAWLVTLPYSKSLRAEVTFRKPLAQTTPQESH
jgi:hypothetical protein